VIATLVFLVAEMRQNNSLIEQNSKSIRDAAIQSLDSGVLDIVALLSGTQENAVLFNTGLSDYEKLQENQKIHFRAMINALSLKMDTSWWAFQNGLLPQGLWNREKRVLVAIVNSPGGRIGWESSNVSDEFREYVDTELADSP